jgi:hypothetical protein
MIIGLSGKKQSGKTTSGNFIASLFMANLEVSNKIRLNDKGQIEVSDLLGDKLYKGLFDPSYSKSNDYIIKKVFDILNPEIKLYSFADILKQNICMDILDMSYDQCYGSDDNKNSPTDMSWNDNSMTARDIMQFVGTDIFRHLKPNVWVDATINKIAKDKPKLAIITDCRFPNEVESIKNSGGKVIRLTRAPFSSDHISENILNKDTYDWNNFDYVIDNSDMSILEQCNSVQEILMKVLS